MTRGRFAPGDVVVRREILVGEVWFGYPTICVEGPSNLLELYVPPGAEFGFPRHGKLMPHRPGEAHSVHEFWTHPTPTPPPPPPPPPPPADQGVVAADISPVQGNSGATSP
ncbi:hypothetical protein ABZ671_08340 [Micromonospora sp. NPDC006766]|uniref:hypothetical protein n=1 Tax=Micromonospora sp. NPDC006766 TaxID=3154778 RepID=UPI0033F379A4